MTTADMLISEDLVPATERLTLISLYFIVPDMNTGENNKTAEQQRAKKDFDIRFVYTGFSDIIGLLFNGNRLQNIMSNSTVQVLYRNYFIVC
jgi:hypothetical protein